MSEASNIIRRLLAVLGDLEHLSHARKCARTLAPADLRSLAREAYAEDHRSPAVTELRGLARAVIRYGGPDVVRRDAAPGLLEALREFAWP